MSSFELQTYKAGRWEIDSYYDDRELAMSEAERLGVTGRHAGVRVVAENYDETTNTSSYNVIFSKMKKVGGRNDDWRSRAQRMPKRAGAAATAPSGDARPKNRAPRPAPKSNSSLYLIIVVAAVLVFGGIAAMIGLQEVAKML